MKGWVVLNPEDASTGITAEFAGKIPSKLGTTMAAWKNKQGITLQGAKERCSYRGKTNESRRQGTSPQPPKRNQEESRHIPRARIRSSYKHIGRGVRTRSAHGKPRAHRALVGGKYEALVSSPYAVSYALALAWRKTVASDPSGTWVEMVNGEERVGECGGRSEGVTAIPQRGVRKNRRETGVASRVRQGQPDQRLVRAGCRGEAADGAEAGGDHGIFEIQGKDKVRVVDRHQEWRQVACGGGPVEKAVLDSWCTAHDGSDAGRRCRAIGGRGCGLHGRMLAKRNEWRARRSSWWWSGKGSIGISCDGHLDRRK
ncbi:hypothetical protein B0H16DRAFT_1698296 [Mycena metata]|uniref:Uncharacterized protein n=1 Tax=Mycena metata TaxID=1033252 RepID=A0AAD7HPV5_9AGAR|nr:hypothetical protein B0H16DRAFT_1698296 [Mycena metata]